MRQAPAKLCKALALALTMALAACAADDIPFLEAPAGGAWSGASPSPDSRPAKTRIKAPLPDSLIGKGQEDLVALLGRPGLVRKEKGVEVWQYAGGSCVMLFYLYGNAPDARRVTYLEAMPQGLSGPTSSGDVDVQNCLAQQMLAASGRPLS